VVPLAKLSSQTKLLWISMWRRSAVVSRTLLGCQIYSQQIRHPKSQRARRNKLRVWMNWIELLQNWLQPSGLSLCCQALARLLLPMPALNSLFSLLGSQSKTHVQALHASPTTQDPAAAVEVNTSVVPNVVPGGWTKAQQGPQDSDRGAGKSSLQKRQIMRASGDAGHALEDEHRRLSQKNAGRRHARDDELFRESVRKLNALQQGG